MYIFKVLKEARMPITLFAALTGISKQTYHHWKRGGGINDQLRLNIAVKTAKGIEVLRIRKALPLADTPTNAKIEYLRKALSL
jgi:hypothetical protein